MIEQCEKLMKVREAHLDIALAELTRYVNVRNGIKNEIGKIEASMRELAGQRASWDKEWQQWVHGGGALAQGQDYATQHMKIALLEKDLAEQHEKATARLMQAQEEVDTARAETARQREALSQITDIVDQMRAGVRKENEARETQRAEDAVSVAWYMARQTAKSQGANVLLPGIDAGAKTASRLENCHG